VLELAFEVGESVGDWAVDLVFKPSVWLGIVLAGIAGVLLGASTLLRNRGADAAAPAGIEAPKLKRAPRRGRADAAIGDDDLGDIEAILRKHGIS
jgi:hypothetical protein